VLLRVAHRAEGGINGELEVFGHPPIGGPAVVTADLTPRVRLDLRLHVLLGRAGFALDVVPGGFVGRGGAFVERQHAQRRGAEPVAVLHADVQVLVAGFADLQPEPAARAEVAAGEAEERPERRVLRVEADVAVKRRDDDAGTHCFTAPLVRPLMNSRCSAKNKIAGGMIASSVPARNTP
jgi:hypothetical protein